MTDIVEWLRKEAELVALDRLNEAATEIERLTREIRALRQDDGAVIAKLQADNERLRTYIETLETELGCGPSRALEQKP